MFLFLLESFPMPEAPTAPTCYREQFVTNEAEAGVVMIAVDQMSDGEPQICALLKALPPL